MKSIFKYGATGLVAFLIGVGAGSAGGSSAAPVAATTTSGTPAPEVTITQEVSVPSPPETVTVTADAPAPDPAAAAPAATSACDNANEALLTGSSGDIAKALRALQNDKSAPSIARQYAQYYLVRDAGQKDLQQMDSSLIQSACN